MRSILKRTLPLLVVPALLFPGSSLAAERADETLPYLQVGPVLVHPALTLKETYRDNVFFAPKNTEGDFITSIAPEITFKLPFRMHEVSLGASANFQLYLDQTTLNTSPYELFVLGDFSIGDRVRIKVGDTYQRNEESPLESPNGTSDDYTSNAAALSVSYAFVDVASLQLDYTRTSLDFLDSGFRTREEDFASLYLYYRVLPNTSAFLEYDFKNIAYDTTERNDNVVHSGLVGATWEISEYSRGTAKAGFLAKNYDDGALDDYSTWTASADLQHQLTEAASLRLLGKRDVNEGKQTGVRYYATTGIFANFDYRFLDRLTGTLECSYSRDSFSDAPTGNTLVRRDTTVRAGVGANYAFNSWLDLSLGYSYLNRDSNYDELSAVVNSVTLAVTARR